MNEQYTVTVAEAILLWDCLESMSIGQEKIYVEMDWHQGREGKDYLFYGIKVLIGANGNHACTITLKDFDSEIASLLEKQAKVQQFKQLKAMSPLFSFEGLTEDEIKHAEELAKEESEREND